MRARKSNRVLTALLPSGQLLRAWEGDACGISATRQGWRVEKEKKQSRKVGQSNGSGSGGRTWVKDLPRDHATPARASSVLFLGAMWVV